MTFPISNTMIFPMIQAPKPTQTFLTLWDMDDTSVATNNKTIKNAHLLLPIKLFQTRAPNQHFGILTNRSPAEESDNQIIYPVRQYVQDLQDFGISIPEDHIIFGGPGGEPALRLNTDWQQLELAMQILEAQIQSLKLTEAGVEIAKKLPQVTGKNNATGPLAELIAAKYHGKNYLITDFLNKHFHAGANEYRFQTGTCLKDALNVLMVDDLASIAEKTKQLGNGFIGIKASEGGKPPKGDENSHAFHQDDYLFELAERIGLAAYARSVLEDPKKHANDDTLLQISALLYAWHSSLQLPIKHFMRFEKLLTEIECDQIANMLEYIQAHPNTHSVHAHYCPVNDLAVMFRNWSNSAFLNTVAVQLQVIKGKMAALSRPSSSTSETDLGAEPKKKGLGSLIKTLSARSSSNLLKRDQEIAAKQEQDEQMAKLLLEEQALKARLVNLLGSDNNDIAFRAQKVKESIEREGGYDFSSVYRSNRVSPSSSVSASASTSTSPAPAEEEQINFKRRSYTPQSSSTTHGAQRPVFVANTSPTVDSLDIEMAQRLQKGPVARPAKK
jgi:hypothetical protein